MVCIILVNYLQNQNTRSCPVDISIELITVDGPPEPLTGAGGRYPVGPVLFDRIATGGAALFDDASRTGEKILI